MENYQLTSDMAANKVVLARLKVAIRGNQRKIAELTGHHHITVNRVLNGKWINKEIIDAAIQIANAKQEATV